MRAADGGWIEQTLIGTGIDIIRWGGVHWNSIEERPFTVQQWSAFNTPDDEGSLSLDEFLAICKRFAITPIIILPFETYDPDGGAHITMPDLVAHARRVCKIVNEANLKTDVYFEVGNEPWKDFSGEFYAFWLIEYYNAIKMVNPRFKIIAAGADQSSFRTQLLSYPNISDYFDAMSSHNYPILPENWSTYYEWGNDLFQNTGYSHPGKENIVDETYVINSGWYKPDAFKPTHGNCLIQLNALLGGINANVVDRYLIWPGIFGVDTIDQSNVGLFRYGDWIKNAQAKLNTSLSSVFTIINYSVMEKWLRNSRSSDVKIRQFAYANSSLKRINLIIINKRDASRTVEIQLPRAYGYVNGFVLHASSLNDTQGTYEPLIPAGTEVGAKEYIQRLPRESAVIFQFFDDEAADVPGSFTQIYPRDGQVSVSTKLTFQWTAASGAKNYHLTVSKNSDFYNPVIDTDVGKNLQYQAMTDLEFGTKYFWKVTSKNRLGNTDADNFGAGFWTAYQHRGGVLNLPATINTEFEADPINANGWEAITYRGSAKFEWSSTESRSGSYSVKISVAPDNRSDVAISKKSAANRISVKPGNYYAVRCWMKGAGIWDPIARPDDLQVAANIYLQFYDSSGSAIGRKSWCSYHFYGSDVWVQRHVLVTAPDKAASLAIELKLIGVGTVWFDNLTIEEYSDCSDSDHNFVKRNTVD
jgi:hypothetical protein